MPKSRPKSTELRTGRDRGVSSRGDRVRPPGLPAGLDPTGASGGLAAYPGQDEPMSDSYERDSQDSDDPTMTRSSSPSQDQARSAYGRALGLLGRREHSRQELKRKLLARGIADVEADAALARLDQRGFQSDRRFADMLVRSRIAQGRGPVRILAELRLHGIETAIAQDAIDGQAPDWLELAIDLCRRRFRGPAADHGERVRRANFLARRGFPAAIARSVVSAERDDDAGD